MFTFKSHSTNSKSIPVNANLIEDSIEGDHYTINSDDDPGFQSMINVQVYRDEKLVKTFYMDTCEDIGDKVGPSDIVCDLLYVTNSNGRTVDKIKPDGSQI